MNYGGTNAGLSCAPACVSTINAHYNPAGVCPINQDNGVCGLIAATNINIISGYSQWSCSTLGDTQSNPCASPIWSGVTCSGNNVVSINLYNVGLSGSWINIRKCNFIMELSRNYSNVDWLFNQFNFHKFVQ